MKAPKVYERFVMRIAIKVTLVAAMLLCVDQGQAKEKDNDLTGMARINATNCGHGSHPACPPPPPPPAPTPRITFNPAAPSVLDTTTVGTQITQIIVTMSNGSQFAGSLGFGPPYFNDAGICAIKGGSPPTVILGASLPPGQSIQNCTITATQ